HGAPGRDSVPLGWQRLVDRRSRQRLAAGGARSERPHPGVEGGNLRRHRWSPPARSGSAEARRGLPPSCRHFGGRDMSDAQDPASRTGYVDPPPRVGFFTDTSVCIGCKACEVACKEWNGVPADGLNLLGSSYDNTGGLGASTWRHVAFVEQVRRGPVPLGLPEVGPPGGQSTPESGREVRWLMMSDVCKHCTHAACLDVCPTGSLLRTEFGTVVVQEDICNGCGYCVPACPYGVIEIRPGDGRAWKCTLCYDRLRGGLEPACAKA